MMEHLSAHGFDPGPTERPLLAGAVAGVVAAVPAGVLLWAFGTFRVVSDAILGLSRLWTAGVLLAGFVLAGAIYGALFRRAASDRDGGWLFGLAYGFLLWIAAPVVVLPLIRGSGMASGEAGLGFLVSFLLWGLTLGVSFPFVHRPFRARLDGGSGGPLNRLGPDAAVSEAVARLRGR